MFTRSNHHLVNIWGAIVYAVGAYISDKYNARFLTMIVCAPIGIAGYAILLCDVSAGARYFATYLIATACFLCTSFDEYWRRGLWADLSDEGGAEVYIRSFVVTRVFGFCLDWMVDCEIHVCEEREGEGEVRCRRIRDSLGRVY
jgi:hypothetical protein